MTRSEIRTLLGSVLGTTNVASWQVINRGYTAAIHLVVMLTHGGSVFVKIATSPMTSDALRTEHRIYEQVRGQFMAKMLDWQDDLEHPLLVLEDLSSAFWPPPWTSVNIKAVLSAIREIGQTEPPLWVKPVNRSETLGWPLVAADSAPFLALGLCSATWLDKALPTLIQAEEESDYLGQQLAHMDIRSDNICIRDGKATIIDWGSVALWHLRGERANWAPSLHAEGGPAPEDLLPNEPGLAALVSGYLAARAGLPDPWQGSMSRNVKRQHLMTAFHWTVRALGFSMPS